MGNIVDAPPEVTPATRSTEATAPVTAEAKVETPEKVVSEEYKNLQREVSKRDARIRELESSHSSVTEIRDEVAKLREDNAALYDYIANKLTPDEEKPNKQESLRQERETQKKVYVHKAAVDNLLKESGIDPNDSKLELARAYWKASEFEKSESEVRRVANETKVSKETANVETLIEERVNAKVEEILKAKGLKTFPGGQPAGQAANEKEIREAYIADPYNPEVKRKYLELRNKRR